MAKRKWANAQDTKPTEPAVEPAPEVKEETPEQTDVVVDTEKTEEVPVIEDDVVVPESTEETPDANADVVPEVKEEIPAEDEPSSLPDTTKPVETKPAEKKTPVVDMLTNSKASVVEKVEWCLTDAPAHIKKLANSLKTYNDNMKPGIVLDEKAMVKRQYALVNVYRGILNTEDYGEFKVKMDVLNLFFNIYSKEAFASQYLARFDYLWEWSNDELQTLLNISEVVSQLSDYANRAKSLKQLNLEYALNPDETIVSDIGRTNFIRYYTA